MTPQEKAKAAYPKATKEQKAIYEDLFGKETFIGKLIDLVVSFETACAITGDDPKTARPYKKPADKEQEVINTIVELRIIAKALKGKHNPNWKDSNELKWTL